MDFLKGPSPYRPCIFPTEYTDEGLAQMAKQYTDRKIHGGPGFEPTWTRITRIDTDFWRARVPPGRAFVLTILLAAERALR